MGYFPNGTAGEIYYDQWCSRCIHEREMREGSDGPGCPIWAAHLLWNYDDKRKEFLDWFIPRDGLHNEQCKMFVKCGQNYDPTHPDLFRPPMKEDQ